MASALSGGVGVAWLRNELYRLQKHEDVAEFPVEETLAFIIRKVEEQPRGSAEEGPQRVTRSKIGKVNSYGPPISFWISGGDRAVVELMPRKTGSLGEGASSIVKRGMKFSLSKMECKEIVIHRPNKRVSLELFLNKFEQHVYIAGELATSGLKGFKITDPPILRKYRDAKKVEAIQTFYPQVLSTFMQQNPISSTIPVKTSMHCALELLRTVKAIHSLGSVHRDVKPDNVLMNGAVYLNDFELLNSRASAEEDYLYWDMAGRLGIASPYTDLVGAALTLLGLLFFNEERFFDPERRWIKNESFIEELFEKWIAPEMNNKLQAEGFAPIKGAGWEEFLKQAKGYGQLLKEEIADGYVKMGIVSAIRQLFLVERPLYELLLTAFLFYYSGMTDAAFDNARRNSPSVIVRAINVRRRQLLQSVLEANGISTVEFALQHLQLLTRQLFKAQNNEIGVIRQARQALVEDKMIQKLISSFGKLQGMRRFQETPLYTDLYLLASPNPEDRLKGMAKLEKLGVPTTLGIITQINKILDATYID